ncbi:MAG: MmcQ/YjbR family DNA-binding protein [Actinomycetota bacterium]
MASIDDVRELALALPGAYEQPSYGGRPSWRTKPRSFTWYREDPDALVLWVDSVEEKFALIESDPAVFSTTDHYDGHPIVLVTIEAIEREELDELLRDSFRLRAPKKLIAQLDAAEAADS